MDVFVAQVTSSHSHTTFCTNLETVCARNNCLQFVAFSSGAKHRCVQLCMLKTVSGGAVVRGDLVVTLKELLQRRDK